MNHTIAICAGLLVVGFAVKPAAAQVVHPGYSVQPGYMVLPPYEAIVIARSSGLEPVGRPVRHGPTYVLGALDPDGQQVRVVVDARLGRILRVTPISGPRYAAPPGRPPARIPMVVDDDDPEARIAGLPPEFEGRPAVDPGYGVPPLRTRSPAVHPPGGGQAGPPPLPRPRPKVASADGSAANAITAQPAARAAPQPLPAVPPKTTAEAAIAGGGQAPPMEE